MGNEQIDGVLEEELQLLKYTGFSTGLYTLLTEISLTRFSPETHAPIKT